MSHAGPFPRTKFYGCGRRSPILKIPPTTSDATLGTGCRLRGEVARMMPSVVGLSASLIAASNSPCGTLPSFCHFEDWSLLIPRSFSFGASDKVGRALLPTFPRPGPAGRFAFSIFASSCPAFRSARNLISQAWRSALAHGPQRVAGAISDSKAGLVARWTIERINDLGR